MTIFSLGSGGNQSGSSGGNENNNENRELVLQGLSLLTQHFQSTNKQKIAQQKEKPDQTRLKKDLKRMAQQIRVAEENNSIER